jgi:hypothetical protein
VEKEQDVRQVVTGHRDGRWATWAEMRRRIDDTRQQGRGGKEGAKM